MSEHLLDLNGGARALFTDRTHGNLSSTGGADAEHGADARERLREQIGVRGLERGYQVHGTTVRTITTPTPGSATRQPTRDEQADGQATALARVGVMVLSADCVPVALAGTGSVAALHAGWRGLSAGVLEAGVEALNGIAPDEPLTAAIGPCAGVCCYEVGEEVHEAFGGAHRRGRNINLRAIARDRLLAAGVSEVLDVGGCTICELRYFSHRREGARAGRQGVVAWLS